MRVLELFAGTKSFSTVAESRGHECITLDNEAKFSPTICMDIRKFRPEHLPPGWKPDIIWASPPCEGFSVASMGTHWKGSTHFHHRPTTIKAVLSCVLARRTVQLIKELNPSFYFIENPVGKLRELCLIPFPRSTVCYCRYGDHRMKPTDIWTNLTGWVPKMCVRNHPDHDRAPSGSSKGTQGLNRVDGARVPEKLCIELLILCEQQLDGEWSKGQQVLTKTRRRT